MRWFLSAFTLLFIVSVISCSTGSDPQMYDIEVSISPSNTGSVSLPDTSIEEGKKINLQAIAHDEYIFANWNGNIDSTVVNPLSLTVDKEYDLTANFKLKTYELTTNTKGEGTINEEVLKNKAKSYEDSTLVKLTANPSNGYKFVEWQGDIAGSKNPSQIMITHSKKITAIFEKKSYDLTIYIEGKGTVNEQMVQQKTIDYEYETVVNLTVQPAEGWKFLNWKDSKSGNNNSTQVVVDEAKEVTASFTKSPLKGLGTTYPIDVDSLYSTNNNFQNFVSNLSTYNLQETPSWDTIFVYKKLGWKDLHMKMYKGESSSGSKPTIVFFHGGGWQNRALNQHQQYAYYFSEQGYNAISVEYRVLKDSSIVTPYDELKDTKYSFSFLRKNANQLEIDPKRLIGVGMSAGGHLVAANAYINNKPSELKYSPKPNALILQNAVIDLSGQGWTFGHEYLDNDWRDFSPLHNIQQCQHIPSLTLSGTADQTAPFSNMEKWDSRYKSKGCTSYLYSFPGRYHGFGNYSSSKSGSNHRDFNYSIYLIQKFLKELHLSPSN